MLASPHVYQLGQVVAAKYRIERPLGAGGMSAVYAGVHLGLEQPIALKVLLPQYAADERLVARFVREAKAAARISGEHVGRVLDVGSAEDGTPYIALELLAGEDLGKLIDRRGALPVGESVDLVLQACDGIARAHAVGIVHRDIKPANLFITERDGEPWVKVIDFGISKVMTEDHALTQTTEVIGSPQYMSPEQVKASRDVDGRTDIWSLGCVLYELLTGKVPFEGTTVMMLGAMILGDAPKPPSAHRSGIPADLESIVMRCLTKNPAGRPATILALAEELAPFAAKCAPLVDGMRRVGPPSVSSVGPASTPRASSASVFVSSVPDGDATMFAGAARSAPPARSTGGGGETVLRGSRSRVPVFAASVVVVALVLGGVAALTLRARGSAPPPVAQPPTPLVAAPPPPAESAPPPADPVPTARPTAQPSPAPTPAAPRRPTTKPTVSGPAAATNPAPAPAPPPAPAPSTAGSSVRDRHGGN